MKWLPIESSPKNTPILATDGKVIVVLQRGECAGDDWPDAVGFGGYEWEWYFEWKNLTHWMPLPNLPEISVGPSDKPAGLSEEPCVASDPGNPR